MNDSGPPVTAPAPPPSHSRSPLSGSSSHMYNASLALIGGIVAILAVIILGYWIYGMKKEDMALRLPVGTRIELLDAGAPQWYEASETGYIEASGPRGFENLPFTVLEVAPVQSNGVTLLLARVPSTQGIVVGALHQDSSFIPRILDHTEKVSLTARADGLAAYTQLSASSTIILFDIQDETPIKKNLGAGRSPRFAIDGSIVALTHQGVIRIDSLTGKRTPVIERSGADKIGAISDDGLVALLPGALTGMLDFFRLDRPALPATSYLGSISVSAVTDIAFVGDDFVVVRSGDTFTVYAVPS